VNPARFSPNKKTAGGRNKMMLRVCPVHRLTTPGTRCLMCGECAHEERYKQCDVCRRVVRNRCDACYECPKCGRVGRVPGLCNAHDLWPLLRIVVDYL
jgi:hypothetical protein